MNCTCSLRSGASKTQVSCSLVCVSVTGVRSSPDPESLVCNRRVAVSVYLRFLCDIECVCLNLRDFVWKNTEIPEFWQSLHRRQVAEKDDISRTVQSDEIRQALDTHQPVATDQRLINQVTSMDLMRKSMECAWCERMSGLRDTRWTSGTRSDSSTALQRVALNKHEQQFNGPSTSRAERA